MSSNDKLPAHTWIPILHLGQESWLGMLGTNLYVGDLLRPKREVDPYEPVGLLPCLGRPYSVIVAELSDRETEMSWSPGSLAAQVPLGAILDAAVASESDYWAGLALAWLGDMPSSEVVIATLESLENADWAAQGIRHKARRIRREKG